MFNRVAIAISAVLSSVATVSVSTNVLAQDSNENNGNKIVITGSHISRIAQEGAFPITVIDRDYIEGSGATSTFELLQLSAFNGGGTFNEQFTQGFTPGSAAFDLRGFGPERTLVLINGRRLPTHPFGASGFNPFVDINSIPLANIQRIEILKDGASAVYGSDAIAGVVNIITYKGFKESRLAVSAGGSTSGGGTEQSISYSTGVVSQKLEMGFTLEHSRKDETLGSDRDYANSLNLQNGDLRDAFGFPGTVITQDNNGDLVSTPEASCPANLVRPSTQGTLGNECSYDYASEQQLSPKSNKTSLSSSISYDFTDLKLSLEYYFSQIDTTSNGYFTSATPATYFFIAQDNPFNPVGEPMLYGRRLTELGAPTIETVNNVNNLNLGLDGTAGEFDWKTRVYYVSSKVDNDYADGWVANSDFNQLITDVEAGDINIFSPLSGEQINNLQSRFAQRGESKVFAQDFNLSGPIADLDAGPVWMAVGLEHRKEEFFDRSDEAILNGGVVGLGASAAEGERASWATYAEFAIPLMDNLEISAAARYDDFDDFGTTTNPKIGLRYTPSDEVLIRASWGTGFRAPSLLQLNATNIVGSFAGYEVNATGNANLRAEESESKSIGIVLEPNDQVELSFDFWNIEATDLISPIGGFTILTARDSDGNLIYQDRINESENIINDTIINKAGLKGTGIDIGAKFKFDTSIGRFRWNNDIAYISKMERESYPGSGFADQAGEYVNPQVRLNSLINWSSGKISQTFIVKYIGKHDSGVAEIDAWVVFDYQISFDTSKSSHLSLGIKNLSDENPPLDYVADGNLPSWPGFNQNIYNPQGRFIYLNFEKSF